MGATCPGCPLRPPVCSLAGRAGPERRPRPRPVGRACSLLASRGSRGAGSSMRAPPARELASGGRRRRLGRHLCVGISGKVTAAAPEGEQGLQSESAGGGPRPGVRRLIINAQLRHAPRMPVQGPDYLRRPGAVPRDPPSLCPHGLSSEVRVAPGQWSHFTAVTNPLASDGPFRPPCCSGVGAALLCPVLCQALRERSRQACEGSLCTSTSRRAGEARQVTAHRPPVRSTEGEGEPFPS